jgi:hypothetical protein
VTRRGAGMLVGQAVVVVGLLVVVYFTLLKPEHNEPPFGVGGAPAPGQVAQGGGTANVHPGGRGGGAHAPPGHGPSAPAPTSGGAPPAPSPVPAGAPTVAAPSAAPQTPSEQQYRDTVSEIFGRL